MTFTNEALTKALYLAAKAFVTSFEMDSQVKGQAIHNAAPPIQTSGLMRSTEEEEAWAGTIPECPKHHKPMKNGKYGWYCTQKDEHGNKNGYCSQKA